MNIFDRDMSLKANNQHHVRNIDRRKKVQHNDGGSGRKVK
jgi:hypothetical protein